jgi:peptidoglycan/LPS O-acetylase OafA/YrhL
VIDDSWRTYFDWAALPSNLLFTHSMKQHSYLSWNIVSWSIGAEWWTYIVAIPLMRFLASGRSWRLIVLALLAMVGIVLLVHFNPAQNLDITFDYGFFRCLPEFSLGLVLYRLYQKSWGKWAGKDAVLGTLLLLIALLFHFKINDLYVLPLFALLILGTVYNEGRAKDWLGRPFMIWLGEISYSIYLVHGLWFMVGWFSFPLLGLTSLSAGLKLLYALGFLACTLGMSHYTHAWVEKRWRG